MTIGLIEDLITSTSLADLRSERDRQAQRVEEVKHRRDNILQELTVANGSYLMAQQMVAIKEAMEPKPAQSPTKESSNGDSPTGRESVLQVIREKPGLRPQGIRDALEAKRIVVKEKYVSTILQRLKEKELVEVKKGGYFVK